MRRSLHVRRKLKQFSVSNSSPNNRHTGIRTQLQGTRDGRNNSNPPFSASVYPQSMTQSLNCPTRQLSTSIIRFVLTFDR
jgi:hypothetical protein